MTSIDRPSSRARKRFWWQAALAGGMAAAVLCLGMARAQDIPPDPRVLERGGTCVRSKGIRSAQQSA
jgi:hypothetical protein